MSWVHKKFQEMDGLPCLTFTTDRTRYRCSEIVSGGMNYANLAPASFDTYVASNGLSGELSF
jgi:hypothetical protein